MDKQGMQQYLPDLNEERLRLILSIKEDYNAQRITLQEGKRRLKQELGTVFPYEIAAAEQQLKTIEDDECHKENIQHMLDLFGDVMSTTRPDLPEEHPIACYYRENDLMRKTLLAVEDLVQYPVIKNQWYELYDQLQSYNLHLARKQNQLYSLLEQKGFDRPTTTMWQLDNFIRDEIRNARQLLDSGQEQDFIAQQATIVADIRDLMVKEETVLYPTALAMISPEEFEHMKLGDREIGFAGFSLDPIPTAPAEEKNSPNDASLTKELAALLARHGMATSADSLLEVTTGQLTLEQINLIFQHMPVDLSFVDEEEIVRFYSDTQHRVFPRSRNVIGRKVVNCHPRSSVHVVKEIIDKFRRGEQSTAEFWINKPDIFIYITYVAVRDAKGNFRGVLEMMQDCTRIRSLTGSQTLLTWDNATPPTPPTSPTASMHPSGQAEAQCKKEEQQCREEEQTSSPVQPIPLTPATRLTTLLAAYPWLKDELPELNARFAMLKTPLARLLIPKATLQTMAARSGMPLDELLDGLAKLIARHQ